MAEAEDLTCAQLVELVTEYLESSLDRTTLRRFEEHLAECGGCAIYLHQIQTTVALTGRLREEQLAPAMRAALVHAFTCS